MSAGEDIHSLFYYRKKNGSGIWLKLMQADHDAASGEIYRFNPRKGAERPFILQF
jgi:hypothetical protein